MVIPVLAWRNIWRHRSRSLIIVGAVALGMLAGLFILALYEGMIESRIRTIIEDEVSHLQIHHPEFKKDYRVRYTITDIDSIVSEIKQINAVAYISARFVTQGMLATAAGSSGVEIRGVHPASENDVSKLKSKVQQGSYFTGTRKNELLVGRKLADKKGLKLNAKVVLTFSDKDQTITSGAFRITGIYESTNTALDERIVYTRSEDLGPLLNLDDEVHEIALVLKKDQNLIQTYHHLETYYPHLQTKTWNQLQPESELLVTVFNQYGFIVLLIVMLTLAFGIVNTMLMAILERTKETGMMIALGMTKIRVYLLVLLETFFLTVIGSPVGIFLAWMLCYHFSKQGIDTTAFAESLMGDFGFEKIVYPKFPVDQSGKIIMLVVATAILSSVIPAVRAIRMEPADALRT